MPAKLVAACLALVLVCRYSSPIECNEQQKDDRTQHKNQLGHWLDQARQTARNSLENFAKPQREFSRLILRYHNFFSQYKLLYEAAATTTTNKRMPTPMDLLKAEFAQMDQELYLEFLEAAHEGQKDDAGAPPQTSELNSIETADYLYEALERVITRLESLDIKDAACLEGQLNARPYLTNRTSEEIKKSAEFQAAVERVKRIGIKTAKGLMRREASTLIRVVLLKVIAAYLLEMTDSHIADSPLGWLVVATASQSYMTRYLNSIRNRSIISLLNQAMPSWRPGQRRLQPAR